MRLDHLLSRENTSNKCSHLSVAGCGCVIIFTVDSQHHRAGCFNVPGQQNSGNLLPVFTDFRNFLVSEVSVFHGQIVRYGRYFFGHVSLTRHPVRRSDSHLFFNNLVVVDKVVPERDNDVIASKSLKQESSEREN